MKISVLIAATKAGAQIGGALASVRAQAHPDWELIVVEYGGADATRDIVNDFEAVADRPVHYDYVGDDGVAPAARNRLLQLATGDPVAFLEPADSWAPRHLANALQQLEAGADLAVSDLRYSDRKTGRALNEVATPATLFTNPVRTLFSRDAIASPSTVVFRRELATRAGGFDEHFRAVETRDFWLACALKNARFAATRRATCQCLKPDTADTARAFLVAEQTVVFYEKHRDLAAVPAALRRRLLAASLVAHGRLLRGTDPARAARCFWRAWSLQPVHVQTLGQFALTGWRSGAPPAPPAPESRRPPNSVGNESVGNGP